MKLLLGENKYSQNSKTMLKYRYINIFETNKITTNSIGVTLTEAVLAAAVEEKALYFSDRAMNGDLPPGFEYLTGNTGNLSTQLTRCQEK